MGQCLYFEWYPSPELSKKYAIPIDERSAHSREPMKTTVAIIETIFWALLAMAYVTRRWISSEISTVKMDHKLNIVLLMNTYDIYLILQLINVFDKRGLAIQGPLIFSKDNKFHFLIFCKCIKIFTALKDAVLGHAKICPTATSINSLQFCFI